MNAPGIWVAPRCRELMQAFAVFTESQGGSPIRWRTTNGGDKKVYNMRKVIADYEAGRMLRKNVHALMKRGYSTEQALEMLESSAEERALYYRASGEQAP